MTEQEIIDFLKKNKETGIAFAFIPEEVQVWAITNPQEILVYSRRIGQEKGTWERRGGSDYPLHYDSIYALPDSFQLKQESKGECEEESEHKCIADSMLLAASVIKSNCIKTKCEECVLFRNEECLLNTHPGYWDLIQLRLKRGEL